MPKIESWFTARQDKAIFFFAKAVIKKLVTNQIPT